MPVEQPRVLGVLVLIPGDELHDPGHGEGPADLGQGPTHGCSQIFPVPDHHVEEFLAPGQEFVTDLEGAAHHVAMLDCRGLDLREQFRHAFGIDTARRELSEFGSCLPHR